MTALLADCPLPLLRRWAMKGAMIGFRYPWYGMAVGALALLVGFIAPMHSPLGFASVLGGSMLLFDGSVGDRVLPHFTPHASFPEDWREIERNLYLRGWGLARLLSGAVACIGLGAASVILSGGDWQGWYLMATGSAWMASWVVVALKGIRDALANDL